MPRKLALTAEELSALGAFLEARLVADPCDNTRRRTKEWILKTGIAARSRRVLDELSRRGGCCCDCEVIHNVTRRALPSS